jgi:hypothetical protein
MDLENLVFNIYFIKKRIEAEKEKLKSYKYFMKLRDFVDMDNAFIAYVWEIIRKEYILTIMLLQTLHKAYNELVSQYCNS